MEGRKTSPLTSHHLICKLTTRSMGHLQVLMLAPYQSLIAYQVNRIFSLSLSSVSVLFKRDSRPHPTALNSLTNFSKWEQGGKIRYGDTSCHLRSHFYYSSSGTEANPNISAYESGSIILNKKCAESHGFVKLQIKIENICGRRSRGKYMRNWGSQSRNWPQATVKISLTLKQGKQVRW